MLKNFPVIMRAPYAGLMFEKREQISRLWLLVGTANQKGLNVFGALLIPMSGSAYIDGVSNNPLTRLLNPLPMQSI